MNFVTVTVAGACIARTAMSDIQPVTFYHPTDKVGLIGGEEGLKIEPQATEDLCWDMPTLTAQYEGVRGDILNDPLIAKALDEVLAELAVYVDQDRVVRVEEFIDPEGGPSSLWLRVLCPYDEATSVHDAIDDFYNEWLYDWAEKAPIGILVGVGA